jgi:hypothetical protein
MGENLLLEKPNSVENIIKLEEQKYLKNRKKSISTQFISSFLNL